MQCCYTLRVFEIGSPAWTRTMTIGLTGRQATLPHRGFLKLAVVTGAAPAVSSLTRRRVCCSSSRPEVVRRHCNAPCWLGEHWGYRPGRFFSDLPPRKWTQGPELHRLSLLMRQAGALALPGKWWTWTVMLRHLPSASRLCSLLHYRPERSWSAWGVQPTPPIFWQGDPLLHTATHTRSMR